MDERSEYSPVSAGGKKSPNREDDRMKPYLEAML
jgi:hypothetical protein